MSTNATRRLAINEAVKKAQELNDPGLGPRMIEIGGKSVTLQSYGISIELLAYNLRNGRFKAELLELEGQLSRQLDPLEKEDANLIRKMLLDQEPSKTATLLNDIKRIGQTEPGIITSDGFVINGNKRMAILETLMEAEPAGKYQNLIVMVLPSEVGEKDLWRLEAGLQLSQEKRIAYGPINNLLKIDEGIQSGLSHREIASCIYGLSEKDVAIEIERLRLIETYLEWMETSKNYKQVERFHEHFINLQDGLARLKKLQRHPTEIKDFQIICFEAIKAGCTHTNIRELANIFRGREDRFPRAFAKLVDAKKAMKLDRDLIDDAIDVKKNEEQGKRPQRLIDRVIETLKLIKTDSPHFIEVTPESLQELKMIADGLQFKHRKAQKPHGTVISKKR